MRFGRQKAGGNISDNQRRGPLDSIEKRYIRENSDRKSAVEIAGQLRRSPRSINNFIKKEGLRPYIEADLHNEEAGIRRLLKAEPWYYDLKMQFTADEIVYFENLWVTLNKQLECDVLDSEKLQMKKYITFEILKDRIMRTNKKTLDDIAETQNLITRELNKGAARDVRLLKDLSDKLGNLQNLTPSLIKEFKDLSAQQAAIDKALKISRDDRVKQVKDAKLNWSTNLKTLNDPYFREKVGKHMEVHAAAQRLEVRRFLMSHKFIDETYDEPLKGGKYESDD